MYESFETVCPKCGSESIKVVEATISSTGQHIALNSDLYKDGFEVDNPEGLKDSSTEDEKCQCTVCGHEYDLSEVTL